MVLVIHWISSAWFLLARLDNFSSGSWLTQSGFDNINPISNYIHSLYWTIITMTTVGYGDITPARNIEFVFTMIVALLGASSYAYIIANVSSLISNLNAARSAFRNKVQAVNQYLFQRNLPDDLNNKVKEYYEYLWSRYKGHREREFFDDIPVPLRLEILKNLTKEFINKAPLFKYSTESLQNALLLSLKKQTYPPDCNITFEGDIGKEIYFIAKGNMKIISVNKNKEYGDLIAGDYFGDISLLLNEKRTASVRTLDYCDVFCLDKEDFLRIKDEYPEFKEVLKSMSTDDSEKRTNLILDQIIL